MIYEQIGKELIELLGLKGSPVAVKLAKTPADIPPGYQKINEKHRHCQFVQDARLKGMTGYATQGVPNMTLGCNGSRKYSGIAEDEVILGFPPKELGAMVEALKAFKQKWG